MTRRSAFERHFEYLHREPPPKIRVELELEEPPETLEATPDGKGGWRARPTRPAMDPDEVYTRLTMGVVGLVMLAFLIPVAALTLVGVGYLLLG